LPVYDGHDGQHGRAQEIGRRIPEVGGTYPAEEVGGEGAEDGQRPENRDYLQHRASLSESLSRQRVVLLVGDHAARQRHTVGEVIHTCYFYYIPNFLLGQTESLEACEVFRVTIQRSLRDLDCEVQYGRAALVEAGSPMIQRDAVGQDGVAQCFAQGGAVGDQAVEATVRHRDGHRDHLPLRGVQVRGWLVELAVVGEPGGEPLGTVAVSPEDVGDEPDHLPGLPEEPLQVLGQLGLFGDGKPADGYPRPLARDVFYVGHRSS